MTNIRAFEEKDWDQIWRFCEEVFRAGETYTYPRDITKDQAYHLWITTPKATFVMENVTGDVVGTYYIKANQMGPGDHVCNCGYIVDATARGQGVAQKLNLHSQEEAIRQGFRAMQYNAVVSTNKVAVALWQKMGFDILASLPEAFRHPKHGFVDAYVMYKTLQS